MVQAVLARYVSEKLVSSKPDTVLLAVEACASRPILLERGVPIALLSAAAIESFSALRGRSTVSLSDACVLSGDWDGLKLLEGRLSQLRSARLTARWRASLASFVHVVRHHTVSLLACQPVAHPSAASPDATAASGLILHHAGIGSQDHALLIQAVLRPASSRCSAGAGDVMVPLVERADARRTPGLRKPRLLAADEPGLQGQPQLARACLAACCERLRAGGGGVVPGHPAVVLVTGNGCLGGEGGAGFAAAGSPLLGALRCLSTAAHRRAGGRHVGAQRVEVVGCTGPGGVCRLEDLFGPPAGEGRPGPAGLLVAAAARLDARAGLLVLRGPERMTARAAAALASCLAGGGEVPDPRQAAGRGRDVSGSIVVLLPAAGGAPGGRADEDAALCAGWHPGEEVGAESLPLPLRAELARRRVLAANRAWWRLHCHREPSDDGCAASSSAHAARLVCCITDVVVLS